MACSARSFVACLFSLAALGGAAACGGEEPGVGSGSSGSDSGSSSGSGTEGVTSESSDSVEPDSSGSSTSGGEEVARICDGSEGIRLAMVLGGGGQVLNEIEREIGFYYLYVLGTCQYFALPADSGQTWPDAHTGMLDEATEEQLSLALDYGNLADVAGGWGTSGSADGSTLLVSDGTITVACAWACEDGPAGAQALWDEMGWIDELWAAGEPLTGPLRVSVIGWADSTIDELGAPWPLPIDPWSIAISGDDLPTAPGDAVLVEDEAHVATLRELRRQYREDDLPQDVVNSLEAYGHLTFLDEGGQDLFQLWMRDALPIEEANGLIPLPPP